MGNTTKTITLAQSNPAFRGDKLDHESCGHPNTTWARRQCRAIQMEKRDLAGREYSRGWNDGRAALAYEMTQLVENEEGL